jgi:small-conductance mechanosensitive channel
MVIVPNSLLVDSILVSYRASDGRLAVPIELGVVSGSDLEQVSASPLKSP